MQAFKLVQRLVSALGDTKLKIDGDFGPRSMTALSKLSKSASALVNQLASELGIELDRMISISDARVLASRVSKMSGVPLSYLVLCLELENPRVGNSYVNEVRGTFRGLGQFNRKTWSSVSSKPWSAVSDPMTSIQAIADLYLANRKYHFASVGLVPYTDEVAYLYHNQGAPSAKQYLTTGSIRWPDQSSKALKVFAVAQRQKDEYKNRTFAKVTRPNPPATNV